MAITEREILGDQGFSLTELIVVIALIGILLGIAGLNFNQWQVKNNVEAQVRQVVTDISDLRVRAITTKQRHSFTLYSNYYVFKSYSSDDEPATGGTVITGGTHNVKYNLVKSDNTLFSGDPYQIDPRGMLEIDSGTKIFTSYNNASPTLDCLTIHKIRINPGKRNGTNCDDK